LDGTPLEGAAYSFELPVSSCGFSPHRCRLYRCAGNFIPPCGLYTPDAHQRFKL